MRANERFALLSERKRAPAQKSERKRATTQKSERKRAVAQKSGKRAKKERKSVCPTLRFCINCNGVRDGEVIKENCNDLLDVHVPFHFDIVLKVDNNLLLFFAISIHNLTERLLLGSICVESVLDAYFPEEVYSFLS